MVGDAASRRQTVWIRKEKEVLAREKSQVSVFLPKCRAEGVAAQPAALKRLLAR